MKRVIINADDFGWDQDTFASTVDLIDRGWVTSATLVTGRALTSAAISYARNAPKRVSFGLHFNMVDGHPALAATHRSLVDRSGRFWPSHRQRMAALLWRFDPDDITRELRAQLMILRTAGVEISHVDSHGHLHKFPCVVAAMISALNEFGISKIRRPQNIYVKRAPSDLIDRYCWWRFPRSLKTTDYHYAIDPLSSDWLENLSRVLLPGVTEISVHPGRSEHWRRFEFYPFRSREPADTAATGIELMSYHDLP